ncbi:hypothetical protein Y032_0199g1663 [Ancylostoma ceylanicum]|uniref:Uncharacterized protein n=1 Tax=Ancylostoma ceylanicum TaxID=53326 RepID=A0A016SNR6_9BILA|nr:hypothetical protein Y032_0199g1663 [Ancylostoma ceylanicum]
MNPTQNFQALRYSSHFAVFLPTCPNRRRFVPTIKFTTGSVYALEKNKELTNLKNHAGSVEEDVVTICFVLTYSADVHLEQRRRIAMGVREVMVSCFTAISDFSTNRFHLSPETFVTIVIFSVAAVGLLKVVSLFSSSFLFKFNNFASQV